MLQVNYKLQTIRVFLLLFGWGAGIGDYNMWDYNVSDYIVYFVFSHGFYFLIYTLTVHNMDFIVGINDAQQGKTYELPFSPVLDGTRVDDSQCLGGRIGARISPVAKGLSLPLIPLPGQKSRTQAPQKPGGSYNPRRVALARFTVIPRSRFDDMVVEGNTPSSIKSEIVVITKTTPAGPACSPGCFSVAMDSCVLAFLMSCIWHLSPEASEIHSKSNLGEALHPRSLVHEMSFFFFFPLNICLGIS